MVFLVVRAPTSGAFPNIHLPKLESFCFFGGMGEAEAPRSSPS